MTEMNILLIGNHQSNNPGNALLTEGCLNLLTHSQLFKGHKPLINYLDLSNYSFGDISDDDLVDAINSSDITLLCGSIIFNGQYHYSQSGSRVNLSRSLINKIKKPFWLYGVSSRIWSNIEYHHSDKLRTFFDSLSANSQIRVSFRDDGTDMELLKLIRTAEKRDFIYSNKTFTRPVLDPAMHALFSKKEFNGFSLPTKAKRLIINLNGEDEYMRYGTDACKMHLSDILEALSLYIKLIPDTCRILLQPHGPADIKPLAQLIELLHARQVHQRLEFGPMLQTNHLGLYKSVYQDPSAVCISMRIHSINAALSTGMPIIPIISSPRIKIMLANQCKLIPSLNINNIFSSDHISAAFRQYEDSHIILELTRSVEKKICLAKLEFDQYIESLIS